MALLEVKNTLASLLKHNRFLKILIQLLYLLLPLYSPKLLAQKIVYETQLSEKIGETSGIEFFKNDFLTHNDSRGKPNLNRFTERGDLINRYRIECTENNDWEDIAQDKNYLYISVSGNNKGKRKNLNILIVDPNRDFKKIGAITFNYRDQQNFD